VCDRRGDNRKPGSYSLRASSEAGGRGSRHCPVVACMSSRPCDAPLNRACRPNRKGGSPEVSTRNDSLAPRDQHDLDPRNEAALRQRSVTDQRSALRRNREIERAPGRCLDSAQSTGRDLDAGSGTWTPRVGDHDELGLPRACAIELVMAIPSAAAPGRLRAECS